MFCFAVVVAACLPFVPAFADPEKRVQQALQSISCLQNGSCSTQHWPLQLDWLDENLHFVLDKDLNSSSALLDESKPILIAKRLVIVQHEDYNSYKNVINKVILVDELVCWKTTRLSFINTTIIAKVAVIEDVSILEGSSIVSEMLRLKVNEVYRSSLFASKVYLHPQNFMETVVVSNLLLTTNSPLSNGPALVTYSLFIVNEIDIASSSDGVNAYFQNNLIFFSSLKLDDNNSQIYSNKFIGNDMLIENVFNFTLNTLFITGNLHLKGDQEKFTDNEINSDEENVTSATKTARRNENVFPGNNVFKNTSRNAEVLKMVNNELAEFLMNTTSNLPFCFHSLGHVDYRSRQRNNAQQSNWNVTNLWIAVPALLATLMNDSSFIADRPQAGVPPYLQNAPTKMVFDVKIKFNYTVLNLIETHLQEANQQRLTKLELRQRISCSNVNSSDSIKVLLNEPLPIDRTLQYRAQDVLATTIRDSFLVVDAINVYCTRPLMLTGKTLVANTISFFYGFSTSEQQHRLKNLTLVADTVVFESFERSSLNLTDTVIVARNVFFKTKHAVYGNHNFISNVFILAETISFSETSDSQNSVQQTVLVCQDCVLIGKNLEFKNTLVQVSRSFLFADFFYVWKCSFCVFSLSCILANQGAFSGYGYDKAVNTNMAWYGNKFYFKYSVRFYFFNETLVELDLVTSEVYYLCEKPTYSQLNMFNVTIRMESINFGDCPKAHPIMEELNKKSSKYEQKPKWHLPEQDWSKSLTLSFMNLTSRYAPKIGVLTFNNDSAEGGATRRLTHNFFDLFPELMNLFTESIEQCHFKLAQYSLVTTAPHNQGVFMPLAEKTVSYSVSINAIANEIRARFQTLRVETQKVKQEVTNDTSERTSNILDQSSYVSKSTSYMPSINVAETTTTLPNFEVITSQAIQTSKSTPKRRDQRTTSNSLVQTEVLGKSANANGNLAGTSALSGNFTGNNMTSAWKGVNTTVTVKNKIASSAFNKSTDIPPAPDNVEGLMLTVILLGASNGIQFIIIALLLVSVIKLSRKRN